MKSWMWVLVVLVLAGCMHDSTNQPNQSDDVVEPTSQEKEEPIVTKNYPLLEDLGLAPELENEVWLNSEAPLRLADLRGEVVLLDMWTFG